MDGWCTRLYLPYSLRSPAPDSLSLAKYSLRTLFIHSKLVIPHSVSAAHFATSPRIARLYPCTGTIQNASERSVDSLRLVVSAARNSLAAQLTQHSGGTSLRSSRRAFVTVRSHERRSSAISRQIPQGQRNTRLLSFRMASGKAWRQSL